MNEHLSRVPRNEKLTYTPYEYELLGNHTRRTDGVPRTGEQTRAEYMNLTDRLIYNITHGVEEADPDTKERVQTPPDTVIFLDKSARPISWLVLEAWDRLAIDDNGNVMKRPDFAYLNIDRNQWTNSLDADGYGTFDINRVDPSIIRSLRSIFVNVKDKRDGLTEKIDSVPTSLDNKTVLLVDEVKASGRTLDTAEKLLRRAFPTTHVTGTHWDPEVVLIRDVQANADRPPWYSEVDPRGRGVNDRMKYPQDAAPANLTQRLGRWFLSTTFDTPDTLSLQVRKELKQLAHDPDVPVRIAHFRYGDSDEEFDRETQHIERINNGASRQDVEKKLRKIWDGKRGPQR